MPVKHTWRSDEVYGERIVQVREMNGMSQEDLATMIGVSEMDIKSYEQDIVTPTFEQLEAIGMALGFPVAFFCHPIPEHMFHMDDTSLRFHG